MSAVWRCRVCGGVNRGERVCSTCGAVVPRGEPLRAAVRTGAPNTPPPTAPVSPSPSHRELRKTATPDEIWPGTTDDPVTFVNAFDVRPLGLLRPESPPIVRFGFIRQSPITTNRTAHAAVGAGRPTYAAVGTARPTMQLPERGSFTWLRRVCVYLRLRRRLLIDVGLSPHPLQLFGHECEGFGPRDCSWRRWLGTSS